MEEGALKLLESPCLFLGAGLDARRWSGYHLSPVHSRCETSWMRFKMCRVDSWDYCGMRLDLALGSAVLLLRSCCQASALKSHGDHIVEVAPGGLSSVHVFVNMTR